MQRIPETFPPQAIDFRHSGIQPNDDERSGNPVQGCILSVALSRFVEAILPK
jgi:hypothetical protein